jgi:protein CpxP
MKKLSIALIFFVTVSVSAFAQSRNGGERFTPEQRAEMQTKRMTEQLNLNEEQQKQVLALNLERNKKAAEVSRENSTQFREIFQNYNKELNLILTPEQQEKLKEARSKRRGPREGMRRGGRPDNRPAKPQK